MIFEMRTYQLKPGTVPQAEQAFADKIGERVKLSRLAGFWHTEVGDLNKIIHIWPYKDIVERTTDPADTLRFHALRLHEVGMIKSTPQKIISQGTDWRFLNELKKEMKS